MTITTQRRRPDRWFSNDLPVLFAVADMLDTRDEVQAEYLTVDGLDEDAVSASMVRLYRNGYLEGIDTTTMGGASVMVTALSERGMREVGEWPTPESAAERILAGIEAAAADAPDEPTRSKLRAAAAVLGQGALDTGTNVLATVLAKAMGLG